MGSAKAGVEESKRPKGKGGGKGGEGKAVKSAKGKRAKSGKDANPSTPPSKNPTADPTKNPTAGPTKNPTAGPTKNPTAGPTNNPTAGPTGNPFICAAGYAADNASEYLAAFTRPIPTGDTAENLDACWEAVSNFGNFVGVYWNFVMGTCRAIVNLSVFDPWQDSFPDDQNTVKLCLHLPSLPVYPQ